MIPSELFRTIVFRQDLLSFGLFLLWLFWKEIIKANVFAHTAHTGPPPTPETRVRFPTPALTVNAYLGDAFVYFRETVYVCSTIHYGHHRPLMGSNWLVGYVLGLLGLLLFAAIFLTVLKRCLLKDQIIHISKGRSKTLQ